jgi:WD40 repeat protein
MLCFVPVRSPPADRAPYSPRPSHPWLRTAGNRRRYARKYAAWLRPTGRRGSALLNGKDGPGGPEGASGAHSASRGTSSDDVWQTLGHTASMSPDERARRGLTPPDAQASDAAERDALASTNSAPLVPATGAAAAAFPREDGARYVLEGVHARGGLGRVVRAHDRLLQRTVAIKELLQRTPSAQDRFMREALITARLQHPGIVPVHEAGRWPSGDPYYSMKLVAGRTLKELIQERKGLDERMGLLPHVLAVAEAVAYAHSQHVIHRDIKPANVIVGDFGETVVVDWGLAKDLSRSAAESEVDEGEADAEQADSTEAATAAGHIMGTPSYMAPEQARGDAIDARADVFSLGAMLYELLAGEPPHTGDSADKILLSALSAMPVPIEVRQPAAPVDLVAIVHKAMARRAGDRYRSAIELAEDIRRYQTGQLVTARHYSARSLARRWIARHRAVVAVAGAAAMALAATGAIAFQRVVAQRDVAQDTSRAAQDAEQTAVKQRNELVFLQAQSWLPRDPTAAIAWLKKYPPGGERTEKLGAMMDEALELGVARHVLRQPTWVTGVGFTEDGSAIIGVLKDGEIRRWDVATGEGRLIGRHSEAVKSSSMSPDGRLVAVGGAGGAVELFALDGDAPARQLGSHADEVMLLIFSADSSRLLTESRDHVVRVWDVQHGGDPLLSIEDPPVASAILSSDGKTVYAGLGTGQIVRVDVDGGARHKVVELEGRVSALAMSPDRRQLAAKAAEDAVQLVDLASGEVQALHELRLGKEGRWGFSQTGRYLTAAPEDGTLHLYEVASGNEIVLRGHEDRIFDVAFSEDDATVLTASDDTTARVWDIATGSVRVLRGHEDDIYVAALSRDGKLAATAGADASARLWQLADNEEVSNVVGRISGAGSAWRRFSLSEDGGMLTTWIDDSDVETWNVVTGDRQRRTLENLEHLRSGNRPPEKLFDPRGQLLAMSQPDGKVAIWSLASGERRELGIDGTAEISAMAASRDWRTLVTGHEDGMVLVWNLAGEEDDEPRVLFRDLVAHGAGLTPDGSRLALALDGRLDLYDVATGERLASTEVAPPRTPSDRQRSLRFSRDGRFLASLSKTQSSFVLWNLDSGKLRRIDLGGHDVTSGVFSPDSSRLAIATGDRTVRVIDTANGQIRLLDRHRDLVWQVAWSPDSKVLASASYDRTIRLWDPDSGRVRVLRGHSGSVESVAFSDDSELVSASADGTVRRWNLRSLPDDRADVINQRLAAATSAIIDGAGPAATPDSLRAARAGGGALAPGAALAPAH